MEADRREVRPPTPRPSRRWLLSGFGLFAALGVVGLVITRGDGAPTPTDAPVARAPAPAAAPVPAGAGANPVGATAEAEAVAATPVPAVPAASGRAPETVAARAGTPAPAGAAPAATAPSAMLEPAATTGTGSAAAVTAVDPVTAEPVVADAAPPPERAAEPTPTEAPRAASPLAGTWKGTWDGRPFTLVLTLAAADRVEARLDVLVGTSYRSLRLAGPLDAAGRFTLAEEGKDGWWMEGALDGARLTGALRSPGGRKATAFSAQRR
ncbi:MAG: hypothetical protein ACK4YP_28720 [Myxococcota bacterium]